MKITVSDIKEAGRMRAERFLFGKKTLRRRDNRDDGDDVLHTGTALKNIVTIVTH